MRSLRVDTDVRGSDGVVVRVNGDIDVATFALLEAPLLALQSDGRPNIVVDMSNVSFIDSTGLRVLVQAQRRAQIRGGSFVIRAASSAALRLFQLTAVDRQLTLEPTLGTAS
jgi:anti-sigma B factor antagonist